MFGFFKKKQPTPPEKPSQAEDTPVQETPAECLSREAPDKAFFAKDPYAVSIKRVGVKFLRDNHGVFEAEHVLNLMDGVFETGTVRSQMERTTWRQAKDLMTGADTAQADRAKNLAVAETAMRVDDVLKTVSDDTLKECVSSTRDVEALIKAYIAIDFGAFPLKEEACVNLRYVENLILDELRHRGVVVKGPFEHLQEQLHAAVKNNADEATVTDMSKTLFSMLINAERLYVATDMDFNHRFPHITYDGRAEVFTKRELAERFAGYCQKEQLGHAGVRELAKEEIAPFFDELWAMGIQAFRVDNGYLPIDIPLAKVMTPKTAPFLDDGHRETRGCLLRELQYGYRIQKSSLDDKQKEQTFKGHMLTMRFNAYRLLGRGLLYALLPTSGKSAVTYYTHAALVKAKADLEENGLTTKALLAEGDDAYAVHEGPARLRVVQLPGEAPEKGLVCVFTDYAAAVSARDRFREQGAEDMIAVLTWDEIESAAQQCAGVMIDLPTYGRQLKKAEFADVKKCRAFDKPIVMQFKNADETE